MLAWLLLTCYLIGSLPFAWLFGRVLAGGDLREMGSGNVGVMNVMVSVSRWAGALVFLLEVSKAAVVITLARAWVGTDLAVGLAALAAFIGTRWMIWLGGAGGRGNTLAATALLLVAWPALAISLVVWIVVRGLARTSFLATRACLLALPAPLGFVTRSWQWAAIGAAFSLVFLASHRTETDDHLLIKRRWQSLWGFLTSSRRAK